MIAILRVCVSKLSDWNRDISRSFLTQTISLQGTIEFKTNTVLYVNLGSGTVQKIHKSCVHN